MVDNGFLVDSGVPGRAGFDLIHDYLDSKVEPVVDDFTVLDLDNLGTFDIVFYFGVLYHMVDPIGALKRLRTVTRGLAVVETAAVTIPGYEDSSVVQFHAGDELHSDYGNWFSPNATALVGMCRAAGFRKVEIKAKTPLPARRRFRSPAQGQHPLYCRMVAHAHP